MDAHVIGFDQLKHRTRISGLNMRGVVSTTSFEATARPPTWLHFSMPGNIFALD
jgi:hypothetical protein